MIKKLAWGAAGLFVVGGLIWFLSGEEEKAKLDDKVHNKDRMLTLLSELKLEYSCIYIRNFNLKLVKLGENKWDEAMKMNMEKVITVERNDKLKKICEFHKDVSPD